jgi:NCS2 family nucleobase:cation symporter-2
MPSFTIFYKQNQKLPTTHLVTLGLQHTVLMASTIGLPAVLMRELGSPHAAAAVALTMIAAGVGTVLQSLQGGIVGSGYLCPNLCGPNFFAAAAGAAWAGGWPLMRGMSIFAGLFATACAFWINRLRRWFPNEVIGVVVMMIATGLVPIGASRFIDVPYAGDPIQNETFAVGVLSLMTMVIANVSRSRFFRLNGIIFGIIVGYASYILLQDSALMEFSVVGDAAWFGFPNLGDGPAFDFRWSLAPTFMIVAICGMLKSFGNLSLAQSYNVTNDSSLDLIPIRGGLVADGLAVAFSGAIGGMPTDTSASNVALSAATGATSRFIGFAAGGLFVLFGFCPKITAILVSMPSPVSGAILLFVTSLIFASAIRILALPQTTPVKPFAVGLGLISGLSAQIAPALFGDVYSWVRPITSSPLALAALVTIFVIQVHAASDWALDRFTSGKPDIGA